MKSCAQPNAAHVSTDNYAVKINERSNKQQQRMTSLALFVAYTHEEHHSRRGPKRLGGLWERSCDLPQECLFEDVSHWLTGEDGGGVRFESIPWEKDLAIHKRDSVSLHPPRF